MKSAKSNSLTWQSPKRPLSLRLASTLENLEHQICGQKCGPKIMTRMVGMSSWLCDHFEMKVWCSDCPCWWWGTLKKLQLPQCGGWFVGLFVVQMASMKIKIRYDGLHRPSKKHKTTPLKTTSQNYNTFNERSDSFVEKKSIWTTTSKKTQTHRRRPGFQVPPWSDAIVSLPWSTRSRPPRLFVEVNPSEKTRKN